MFDSFYDASRGVVLVAVVRVSRLYFAWRGIRVFGVVFNGGQAPPLADDGVYMVVLLVVLVGLTFKNYGLGFGIRMRHRRKG